MNELAKIIAAHKQTDFTTKKAALATVIKVTGSSYRSPGARMYITDDGKWIGSISGGCLEGDALRKSRKIMDSGIAQMITYDTMDDDNNELGVGLGCNGIIHVLLEPVTANSEKMQVLEALSNTEEESALATIYEVDNTDVVVGSFISTNDFINFNKSSLTTDIQQVIIDDLIKNRSAKLSLTNEYKSKKGTIKVFLELFQPPIDLLIFGGGYDAQPVADFAHKLGWSVTIVDECVAHLIPVNFPDAKLSGCSRESVTKNVNVKSYSAAVLMSHNYYYDLEVLQQLLPTAIRYIGILGPKKKGDKMFEEMERDGYTFSEWDKYRIHNPIGVDIGADTPEEIAFSMIAEIKAKFSGKSSGFLKYKSGPIHNKDKNSGEVFKQIYINDSEINHNVG